ncbi:hypothetical protein CALVIDRAFT_562958 [Calocera viscosa TUFC12733]|uniref:Opioid growth factor receptor (OGFr) conserved domain-containing protein n=1 Tax=Calocera viscosa (strain TUFC12733) TaxID=1330018 RepID=A0A167NE45_CALVF|nr:hypothetical protein CALVIDRAFT_562958 [Calocera viscosa TUFC12733]
MQPALLSPDAPLSRDMRDFLSSYPSQLRSPPSVAPNYAFYTRPPAASDGVIAMQKELRGDWDKLEWRHDFVQWLFPIREQGMNPRARPLQVHEIGRMKDDEEVMKRFRESYEIMLAFYGLRLVDPETGELDVTVAPEKSDGGWPARFYNLEHSMHNYLRITRILKSLHELAHAHYIPSFLLAILALQHPAPDDAHPAARLKTGGLVRSMDGYWRHCIRDAGTREWVRATLERVRREGAWGLGAYRAAVLGYKQTGIWGQPPGEEQAVEQAPDGEGQTANEVDAEAPKVAEEPPVHVTAS